MVFFSHLPALKCFRCQTPEHKQFMLYLTVNAGQQFSDGSAHIQGSRREGQEESREESQDLWTGRHLGGQCRQATSHC